MRQLIVVALVASSIVMPANAMVVGGSSRLNYNRNAEQLLDRYLHGGPEMAGKVRDLVTGDARNLRPVMEMVDRAGFEQTRAIGFGLGLAMLTCAWSDQMYAFAIEEHATSGSAMLADSFTDVMGFSYSELRLMVPLRRHRGCHQRSSYEP